MVDAIVQFRNKLPKYLHSCDICSCDYWKTKPGHKSTLQIKPVIKGLFHTLWSFSNDDGNSGGDASYKMNLYFTLECRNSVNLFSTPISLKTCIG